MYSPAEKEIAKDSNLNEFLHEKVRQCKNFRAQMRGSFSSEKT